MTEADESADSSEPGVASESADATASTTSRQDANRDGADEDVTRHKDVVIVTGSSSGIGRATARAFLDEDWIVYATARDPADVDALAEAGCHTAALDVTDDEQVASVVEAVVDEQGQIDCVVNNAGFAQFGPIEDVPSDAVHRQFDVNTYGPQRVARAALPHMRAAEDGTIVNVSSVVGRLTIPGAGIYAGSKAALEAVSDAMRAEVASFGVDVVVIEPGPVDSAFYDRADEELDGMDGSGAYDDIYEIYEDASAMGGFGPASIEPEDVAEAIVNAASATDPAPRYPVGPVARYAGLARFVPDRIRDSVFALARRVFA